MTIKKALAVGLAGNEASKVLTGTSEVSGSRTAVATGSGVILGSLATGVATIGASSIAAPAALPLALAGGLIAGVASLFD